MKRTIAFLLIISISATLIITAKAQDKKPLTTSDFASWKTIKNSMVSNDGKFTAFEINPEKGNGNLVIKSIDSKRIDTIPRGYSASFSPESDFIVCKIRQPEDSVRSAKKKKLKKEEMPKDSLGIFLLKRHKFYAFPNLKQFSLPKENAKWVAFLTEPKKMAKSTDEKDKPKLKKENGANEDQKGILILFQAASGDTISFGNVTEYYYAPLGHSITFIQQNKDSVDQTQITVFDTEKRTTTVLFEHAGTSKKITSDRQGGRFWFLFSPDNIKEKGLNLY
jgi:hypothetical protein